ncbi:MAG: iron ABC transporter permease, partial [Candidatus Limiplasma sp.]|nr:iron ABC transporter permease [Candidatus Limiplasma sp.]
AGGATPIKLALAGAAVSAALSSLVSAVVLPRSQVMNAFRFWQVGSLSGASWDKTLAAAPFLLVAVGAGVLLAPALNALQLGDDVAIGLGVRTGRTRMAGAALGVLLCGSVTALAGPTGFIGLMIPHAVRMVLGGDMRLTIPMTALGGAALLTLADVLGRVLGRPGELEVGIVTAFLGAPILIWIAMRRRVRAI